MTQNKPIKAPPQELRGLMPAKKSGPYNGISVGDRVTYQGDGKNVSVGEYGTVKSFFESNDGMAVEVVYNTVPPTIVISLLKNVKAS